MNALENRAAEGPLEGELEKEVGIFAEKVRARAHDAEIRRLADRLEKIAGGVPGMMLQPGEAWTDAALADYEAMTADTKRWWGETVSHCQSATGGKPAKKWLARAAELLAAAGMKAEFRARMVAWLPLVSKSRAAPMRNCPDTVTGWQWRIVESHQDALKGFAWMCGFEEDRELARVLAALTVTAFKKIPGVGPRAVKIGNACVWALGAMPGTSAVGELAILKARVKVRNLQKGIEKAMHAAAEREGIPREDLEELAVPAFGMAEAGLLSLPIGDFRAEAVFPGGELKWVHAATGKAQKSVPASVTSGHPEALKHLKGTIKDVQKMLPAQRERIDSLFLSRKTWRFADWKERYLDHPLTGILARRLIWVFGEGAEGVSAIFSEGTLVEHSGAALPKLADDTPVYLWHPIGRALGEVLAWREWLETRHVRQPFKQAHREVYLLTDAELATNVYSNRFAAHILKQHQFNALCAARGWRNTLRLMVDDEYPPPHRDLPQWNLRAEFWVEGAGDRYGLDTNETGTYLHLVTDQVRFHPCESGMRRAHAGGGGYAPRRGATEPVPLEEIPPLVLSEIMRDVDLFVGVSSLGNDPNWSDGGPDGRYQNYWQSYAFGDLSATAATRRQLLERLLPKLKIAARCSLVDKFLIVKGDLRTYKIHLGSANILMEPNDEYLCIVPRGLQAAEGVFLPFEGDQTMAVVLSKAFLLADDRKITDKTILSQLSRK